MRCPHCGVAFHEQWENTVINEESAVRGGEVIWQAGFQVCPECARPIIRLSMGTEDEGGSFVESTSYAAYPKSSVRPLAPEVGDPYKQDFAEACAVVGDSPKASAALSRRCLQHLLREQAGVTPGNLADEIQQVLDSGRLPSHVADNLDAIRNVGNFAAHPLKSTNTGGIVEVEPHEAEWLLDLLEELFNFYITQPVRAKAKRDALNAKLQAIGKRPLKTP